MMIQPNWRIESHGLRLMYCYDLRSEALRVREKCRTVVTDLSLGSCHVIIEGNVVTYNRKIYTRIMFLELNL